MREKTQLELFKGYPHNPKTLDELERDEARLEDDALAGRDREKEQENLKKRHEELA